MIKDKGYIYVAKLVYSKNISTKISECNHINTLPLKVQEEINKSCPKNIKSNLYNSNDDKLDTILYAKIIENKVDSIYWDSI
jgi:hypothetical protein